MVSQLFDLPGLQMFLSKENKSELETVGKNTKNLNKTSNLNGYTRDPSSIDYLFNRGDKSIFEPKYINMKKNCIVDQINQIKNLILSHTDYQKFNEEFRYPIVSSHILNDYTSYYQKLQIKKSIPNLNDNITTNDRIIFDNFPNMTKSEATINSRLNSLVLKYYRFLILIKDRGFNIDHKSRFIILLLLKAFNIIFSKKKQLFDTVKNRLMITLKIFLNKLETCDMLFHKVLLNYKTLQTYKIFDHKSSLKQKNNELNDFDIDDTRPDTNKNDNALSNLIKNLLESNLDHLFYIFRYKIEMILPLTDPNSLSKYIEIYGLTLTDLRYYLNMNITILNEKTDRINITQKFLLCCLLSIPFHDRIERSKEDNITNKFYSILNINFRDENNFHYNTSNNNNNNNNRSGILKHCEWITTILSDLAMSLEVISNLLFSYKNFLNLEKKSTVINNYTYNNKTKTEFSQVIGLLNELESKLMFIKSNVSSNDNQSNLLTNKLQNLFSSIYDILKQDNILNGHSLKTNPQVKRIVSTPPLNKSSRGFSLDIVKHNLGIPPKNPLLSNSLNTTKINLSERIEFKNIDSITVPEDTENITEETYTDDHGFIFYNDENDETCVSTDINLPIQSPNVYGKLMTKINMKHDRDNDRKSYHYESLQKLSDDELRRKLNEKILNFANENKLGKNKLRAQKSFELLKRQQDKVLDISSPTVSPLSSNYYNPYCKQNNRNISNSFSTEDTIPIIYEIRELMEC